MQSKSQNSNTNKQKQKTQKQGKKRKIATAFANNGKSYAELKPINPMRYTAKLSNLDPPSVLKMKQKISESYTKSLLCPELVRHAKIPSTLPLPTVSYHLKRTFTVNCNANGQLAVLVNPWFCADSTSTTTGVLINNDATLNVTTGAGSGAWTGQTFNSNISAGNVTAYRLVSAAIQIYPEAPLTSCSGILAGGLLTAAGFSGLFTAAGSQSPGAAFNQSNMIDQLMYYQKAQLAGQQGVRCIYLPVDPTFNMFVGLGSGRNSCLSNQCDQFFWNYYVLGAVANQPMVVEVYWNFELEPQPVSLLQSIADVAVKHETDSRAVQNVIDHPSLVSQSNNNLNNIVADIDETLTYPRKKKLNFLDSAIGFLNDHSAELSSIVKLIGTAFM
jgi:hypothetical protein